MIGRYEGSEGEWVRAVVVGGGVRGGGAGAVVGGNGEESRLEVRRWVEGSKEVGPCRR